MCGVYQECGPDEEIRQSKRAGKGKNEKNISLLGLQHELTFPFQVSSHTQFGQQRVSRCTPDGERVRVFTKIGAWEGSTSTN